MLAAWVLAACAPLVIPAGPPAATPGLAYDGVRVADGVVLPLHVWAPEDQEPEAVVLAVHGFNDYGNFFAAPAAFLAAHGIISYAYDQRGFGRAPNRGIWPGQQALIDDLTAVVEALRRRHPDLPLYVVGESMGGAVAILAATGPAPPAVDGLTLAAPAVWGRSTMPWYQRGALWLSVRLVPGMTVTGRGLGVVASDNVAMLRALGRDPLVIKETRVDAVYGLVNLMDAALAAAPRLAGPTLVLYGARDEVVPAEPVRQFIAGLRKDQMEAGDIRIAVYRDGYHMLLRDLQAETVWRDLAVWLDDPAAVLPSGADGAASAGAPCRFPDSCDMMLQPRPSG
ncbi:MAG: alpha/beta fold hydrolase [Rhodospirillales bacterium]|nr:MAG: alpha/beta fold hydrolase [Rhodospirillales bacterium]